MLFKVLWLAYWCLFRMSRRAENALFVSAPCPFQILAGALPIPTPNPTPTLPSHPTTFLPSPPILHQPYPTLSTHPSLPYHTPLHLLFSLHMNDIITFDFDMALLMNMLARKYGTTMGMGTPRPPSSSGQSHTYMPEG